MENSLNIFILPNEILMKIFKKAKANNKNLSLVCKKFYELITRVNYDNIKFSIHSENFFKAGRSYYKLLNQKSNISVVINNISKEFDNIDEKINYFLQSHGRLITKLSYDSQMDITKFIHLMPNLQVLEFICVSYENEAHLVPQLEKNFIPLKFLEIDNGFEGCSNGDILNNLEIFDVEELVMNDELIENPDILRNRQNLAQKYVEFVNNLKNLKSYSGFCNPEMLKVLAEKNLKRMAIDPKFLEEQHIADFLKIQENLKCSRNSIEGLLFQHKDHFNFRSAYSNTVNNFVFDIRKYFHFQQIYNMLHTPRKLKFITIEIGKELNPSSMLIFTQYLKSIGQNVKKLKISSICRTLTGRYVETTIHQFEQTILSFPNLESIELYNFRMKSITEIKEIKCQKIKEISWTQMLKLIDRNLHKTEYFYTFFKFIRFSNNSLEHLKIFLPLTDAQVEAFDHKIIKKFIRNQKLLTKIKQEFIIELIDQVFIYEAWSEDMYEKNK